LGTLRPGWTICGRKAVQDPLGSLSHPPNNDKCPIPVTPGRALDIQGAACLSSASSRGDALSLGNFAGFPIVAETRNFLITCAEDDADAEARAAAIGETCEADLNELEWIFSTNFQVGGRNQHGTWVHVYAGRSGGASNKGWGDDESSQIAIMGGFSPSGPAPDNQQALESSARFLFVAELAEILMDFTGYGWDRGGSNGEALSIVCGTTFYPLGYYRTAGWGPRVNEWLQAVPRQNNDWVSKTEGTDTNRTSYGCGVLFLYYLIFQLGYSLRQIVSGPSGTLAETFSRLTSKPAAAAFGDFRSLVDAHFPTASIGPAGSGVRRDNIFPLSDAKRRLVSIWPGGGGPVQTRTDSTPRRVELKPGILCPKQTYNYWTQEQIDEVRADASTYGFGDAAFQWTANETDLPARDVWATATIPARRTISHPDGTVSETGNTAAITYFAHDYWNRSTLRIQNKDLVGDFAVDVVVHARERNVTGDPDTTASDSDQLDVRPFFIEEKYWDDRSRCNPIFHELDRSILELAHEVFILKTLPDPPSDRTLEGLIRASERVQHQLARAAESTDRPRKALLAESASRSASRSDEWILLDQTEASPMGRPGVQEPPLSDDAELKRSRHEGRTIDSADAT